MTWKGANDSEVRKYDFACDAVSRLTAAKFGQLVGAAFSTAPVNYNVSNLTYDGNGNILSMNQYGLKTADSSAIIDQLSYHYPAGSNRLLNVVDAANDPNSTLGDFKYAAASKTATTVDYTYDGNGNMVSDQNKKIAQITYNILNLPDVITVSGKGTIKYYYDATGNKLRKRTTDITGSPVKTTTTTYIGGAVYQNDTLQFFSTPEGRMRSNTDSSGWVYDYFLKDHLGNTRMMITDDYNVASPLLEANSYYPFGLQQKGIGLDAALQSQHNKRLYNKCSELQEDFGLDYYDTHFRNLDPQIGRWRAIDPKCELNINPGVAENDEVQDESEVGGLESVSPYMSMADDLILHNDLDGDIFGIDNVVGAIIGAAVEIGTQMVSNAISGENVTNISWSKVGVAAAEGIVTDGSSNLAKAAVKVGGAMQIVTLTGIKAIAKGAEVNLVIDKVTGGASKLAKGVGRTGLDKAANKMISSKMALTKVAKAVRIKGSSARVVTGVVHNVQKSVAKQVVRQAPQKVVEKAVGATLDNIHDKRLN